VNPPLREERDVAACRAALADGTIDAIATDHAPHPREDKDCEWVAAAFGMLGLETALSVVVETMVNTGLMDWAQVAERMSIAPAAISGIPGQGRPLAAGEPANVVLIDPNARWTVEPARSASRSRNTPYRGLELPARVMGTFLRGQATVADGALVHEGRGREDRW